jgi:hypothetical protein
VRAGAVNILDAAASEVISLAARQSSSVRTVLSFVSSTSSAVTRVASGKSAFSVITDALGGVTTTLETYGRTVSDVVGAALDSASSAVDNYALVLRAYDPTLASQAGSAAVAASQGAAAATSLLLSQLRLALTTALAYASRLAETPAALLAASPFAALASALDAQQTEFASLSAGAHRELSEMIVSVASGNASSAQVSELLVSSVVRRYSTMIDTIGLILSGVVPLVSLSLAITILAMIAKQAMTAASYRKRMLLARRGEHAWKLPPDGGPRRPAPPPGLTFSFMGIELALNVFLFFILFFLLTAVFVLLGGAWVFYLLACDAACQDVALKTAWAAVIGVFSASMLLKTLMPYLIVAFAMEHNVVTAPRTLSYIDMYYSFQNLILGFAVAATRMTSSIVLVLLSLGRTDEGVLPRDADMPVKAFDAVLFRDMQTNHPVALSAGFIFFELRLQSRDRRQQARRAARGAPAAAVLSCVPAPQAAARARGEEPGAPDDELVMWDACRRMRARTRWHLAVLLARNPSLRRLRMTHQVVPPRETGDLGALDALARSIGVYKLATSLPPAGNKPTLYQTWLKENQAPETALSVVVTQSAAERAENDDKLGDNNTGNKDHFNSSKRFLRRATEVVPPGGAL